MKFKYKNPVLRYIESRIDPFKAIGIVFSDEGINWAMFGFIWATTLAFVDEFNYRIIYSAANCILLAYCIWVLMAMQKKDKRY